MLPHTTLTSRWRAIVTIALTVAVAGCGIRESRSDVDDNVSNAPLAIEHRAAAIDASGCGQANDSLGSGVLIADSIVLTAAHVVASSQSLTVTLADSRRPRAAKVIMLDTEADLALVAVDDAPARELTLARAEPGDAVAVVTVGKVVESTVLERSLLIADQVRGTARVERTGYRLNLRTTEGDSGSGVYVAPQTDRAPSLVGVVFANSNDEAGTSWAVAGSEIQAFVARWRQEGSGQFVCDEDDSTLTERAQ